MQLAHELGIPRKDVPEGYAGVMDLIHKLTVRADGDSEGLTEAAVRVLRRLFPKWLPYAFAAVISKPLPIFAARINALVTVAVTQWLMGPNSLSKEDPTVVEIERCRYLEESGCVGICINSCKKATESFFAQSMGLPLYIEPNFDDL